MPKTNAYVVITNSSYVCNSRFPTKEYTAQQRAERSMSREPIKNRFDIVNSSREIPENTIMTTPRNDSRIPAILFFVRCSCKNNPENNAMKITFVLIRTDAEGALV